MTENVRYEATKGLRLGSDLQPLKNLGMMDLFKKYKPPRDNSKLKAQPGEIVWAKARA